MKPVDHSLTECHLVWTGRRCLSKILYEHFSHCYACMVHVLTYIAIRLYSDIRLWTPCITMYWIYSVVQIKYLQVIVFVHFRKQRLKEESVEEDSKDDDDT